MHFVAGGAARRVGRVSDDEYETSSYEETESSDLLSDNSEDYVPLTFEYISSNPKRRAGAPAYSKAPLGVLEEKEQQESLSSDAPLEVFLERSRTRRHCGPGAKDSNRVEVKSSVGSHHKDEDGTSSTFSGALPIAFERRKKTRNIGKVKQSTYEVLDAELSVSLPDEDEAPLNAQLIYTLIKRLRNPSDEVSLEAFDFVDFSDENFKEELGPLKQIKALLEEKASNPMMENVKHDHAVKEAVQSLPPDNAIAAKVKAIKSCQIRPSKPRIRLYRGGEAELKKAEAIADLVRRLKDPNTEVPLRAFEEVDWSNRDFDMILALLQPIRAYMEAKEVAKEKPVEGTMSDASVLDNKIKEAIMSLPSEEAVAATMRVVKNRAMSSSPSNGDAIRHLVARLKESGQTVKRCEFDKLDWNDRNFSRELEPLQQIRACMEAMEALEQKPGENVMATRPALDEQIKVAIMSLPPEKVISVKTQMLKMYERASTTAQGSQRVKVTKLSAPAGTKKKLKDSFIMSNPSKKSKAKEGSLSASSSQVMQVGARVMSLKQPKYAAKESTALSAPAKKVRRSRIRGDRSVSISKVDDDTPPGEIIDDNQKLPESRELPLSEAGATSQCLSRMPSRPAGTKKPERRTRNYRQVNISFSSVPTGEPGVIQEENELVGTKRKASRRRAPHKLCRSLSITSLPDLEADELLEEPSPLNTRGVAPAPLAPARKAKPRRLRTKVPGNNAQFDQPSNEVASDLDDNHTALRGKAHSVTKKKRRPRVNNKSCSFLEVYLDEVCEIHDESAAELKGAELHHDASPPKRTQKLVRRRRPAGEGNGHALDYSKPEMGEAGKLDDAQHSNAATAKRRRVNVHRPRSAHTSLIGELQSGEIVERPDETHILYTSSPASTPIPEEASARRVNRQALPARAQKMSCMTCDFSSTARKRRQRLHMSKELSVSAIPENLVGEIVENAPDLLAATASVSGSFSNARLSKVHTGSARRLPLLKGSGRGSLRYADPPNSSLRSSAKSRKEVIMPNVDASFIPDTVSSSPTPPSSALRRSAEAAPHVTMVAAKLCDDIQCIPSV
ncbi:conserved hypothetical protein [Leishmania major strain Friedlin]|uniref:Uncharacterized protein n=1 Tax=Leishmania major TaxID=5664 RepID=E9AD04_LEIMA|nr:conserved hypothetical protein [Leishmania major strain Friedlin]CAG9576627.1 hypothetical_protein_-_conserved [Leishmania major strain Friedlin]CBZ12087.1 conserved hypothetical protein [Leishmania major strain Friedlin]|eukprot:XP_003721833.1 conserved hypothetical protein [Leishmania major strain Friedlin]